MTLVIIYILIVQKLNTDMSRTRKQRQTDLTNDKLDAIIEHFGNNSWI